MGWPCPTCGSELNTRRGMRQHHTKVHEEPLPNRTCKGCGDEFYDPKSPDSYCEDCNPNAGEHNGNWKDAKETSECDRCGTAFSYYPSNKKGVYCGNCVDQADEFLGTPYHEVHDIERLQRECDYCETEFTMLKSNAVFGAGRFCSRECLSNWMSENRKGENHHQWIPTETSYSEDWWAVRREARSRDNHTCQHCGKSRNEIGREPDVHHIKPIREFEDSQEAHSLGNVICLCRSCHRNAEEGNISISNSTSERR